MSNSIFNKKSLHLIKELTIAEFKLRDQGSFLGFIWTLLHPLLTFLILYLLFNKWTGKFVYDFKGYLLVGIVQWSFFAGTTTYTAEVFVRKRGLLKNFAFPAEVLIVASVFTGLISHILEFMVLLGFLFFTGTHFTFKILCVPFIILIQLTLVLSASFLLATLYIFYKDTSRIWNILTMLGFFVTPIFYSLPMLSKKAQQLLLMNPMTHIVNSTRFLILGYPDIRILGLFMTFLLGAVFFAAAYYLFKRLFKWFPEVL